MLAGLPAGGAAPAVGEVEFAPPGMMTGAMTATVPAGSFFATYQVGTGASATFEISSPFVRLDLVDVTEDFVVVGGEEACQVPCGNYGTQRTPIEAGPATVRLDRLLANYTFILQPHAVANATFAQASVHEIVVDPVVSYGPDGDGTGVEPFPAHAFSRPNLYYVGSTTDMHHLAPSTLAATYGGSFFFLVADAMVLIENATGTHEIRTGSWREYAPGDPTGLTQARLRVHHVALVGTLQGKVQFAYEGPHAHVLGRDVRVAGVETLSIPIANARVQVGDQDYSRATGPFLDIEGRFNVSLPDATGPTETGRIRAAIDGDVVRISENRLAAQDFPTLPVAATATGLTLLLVVYATVSWIRRGAVYVAVRALEWKLFTFAPLAARLDLAKVLEHPVRRGIMQFLSEGHAMQNLADVRREVAAAFGISTMAAYFHLRTLWRANQLTVVRMGSRHFIGPNSGGMGPREQRVAASLLHPSVGLAIAEHLCQNPGARQADLVAAVQGKVAGRRGQPLSRVAILHWIRKFEVTQIVPTHLVTAFGSTLNPSADAEAGKPFPVSLVRREIDSTDARAVRYYPADVLYEVVQAFVQRKADLGGALVALTRMRVQRAAQPRRPAPAN